MEKHQFETAVAFFVFNRPGTTKIVFDEIRKIKPKKLFVIADGPRNDKPGEIEKCIETRKIIDTIDWDCEIHKNYSEENLGCKIRISSGISWVFGYVEEAIILEDDCVPDLSFFPFCETLLKKYSDDKRIMMISGSNLLFDSDIVNESYYFSQYYPIWGWATWKRAWKLYDIKMSKWPEFKRDKILGSIYSNRLFIHYIERILDDVFADKDDTWDAQWFFSCLVQRGLCISPAKNLIKNIGVKGTRPQQKKLLGCKIYSVNLNIVQDPDIFEINPHYQDFELKALLRMADYSYLKYFIVKLLKIMHIFGPVEKLYLKHKS